MLACIAQCAWSVTFAQREIWIALVLMCILLACLVKLLVDSDALLPHASRLEYWVLYAPFALHALYTAFIFPFAGGGDRILISSTRLSLNRSRDLQSEV